ncbi:hypothetical protein D3C84_792450 [compost metagenome]
MLSRKPFSWTDVNYGFQGALDDLFGKGLRRVVRTRLATIAARCNDEGTFGIDKRITPRVGSQQLKERQSTITQLIIASAGCEQAVGLSGINRTLEILTDSSCATLDRIGTRKRIN